MSKIDKLDQFNSVLLTLLNLPKNTKHLFELIKGYEFATYTKVDYSKFDDRELKRFVLWYILHKRTKLSTCKGYVKTLKLFLNQVYAIDVKVPVSEIASKIRILTSGELFLIRMTKLEGFRNKISDVLRFRCASGCEHGKFKIVTPETDHFDPKNYFTRYEAKHIMDSYAGKMPTIPKSDFDSGVKQLLHALKIDRKVKIGDELVPVCDMDVDLLIRNTFIYHASNHSFSINMIMEMFEHDDLSHYFPAISSINNQIIDINHNILTAIDGIFNLIAQNETPPPDDLSLPRFGMHLQKVMEREHSELSDNLGSKYMGVGDFSFIEILLTEYMILMHKYGKKDFGN